MRPSHLARLLTHPLPWLQYVLPFSHLPWAFPSVMTIATFLTAHLPEFRLWSPSFPTHPNPSPVPVSQKQPHVLKLELELELDDRRCRVGFSTFKFHYPRLRFKIFRSLWVGGVCPSLSATSCCVTFLTFLFLVLLFVSGRRGPPCFLLFLSRLLFRFWWLKFGRPFGCLLAHLAAFGRPPVHVCFLFRLWLKAPEGAAFLCVSFLSFIATKDFAFNSYIFLGRRYFRPACQFCPFPESWGFRSVIQCDRLVLLLYWIKCFVFVFCVHYCSKVIVVLPIYSFYI